MLCTGVWETGGPCVAAVDGPVGGEAREKILQKPLADPSSARLELSSRPRRGHRPRGNPGRWRRRRRVGRKPANSFWHRETWVRLHATVQWERKARAAAAAGSGEGQPEPGHAPHVEADDGIRGDSGGRVSGRSEGPLRLILGGALLPCWFGLPFRFWRRCLRGASARARLVLAVTAEPSRDRRARLVAGTPSLRSGPTRFAAGTRPCGGCRCGTRAGACCSARRAGAWP